MGKERHRRAALIVVRLHLVVEGQTEESFVKSTLCLHLGQYDVATDVHSVTTSRQSGRPYRGGIKKYRQIRRDLELWSRQDTNPDSFFSTMVDLYRLPGDFPGFDEAKAISDPRQRVSSLEQAFAKDLDLLRFIPYIQLHEFEALMFTDIETLREAFPDREKQLARLAASTAEFSSPELIDSGSSTSPSKRIVAEIPEYAGRKTSVAVPALQRIGLEKVRAACSHFDQWILALEALGDRRDDSNRLL